MTAVDGLLTVNDVVTAALKKSGVFGLGQTPDGSDMLDAQSDLSDMLAQWNVKTWLVFEKLDVSVLSTGQITPYTIGPAGNISLTSRPDRVEAAYVKQLVVSGQSVDQPLKVIPSREDYSKIALKSLVAFPKAVFLDTASPVGNLSVYPWPNANIYEIHLIVKNTFPLLLPLNLSLAGLPGETRAAMKFCLARRIRQGFGKGLKPDPELNALAKDSLETLRMSHVQVPQLVVPPAALGRGEKYNIFSDQSY